MSLDHVIRAIDAAVATLAARGATPALLAEVRYLRAQGCRFGVGHWDRLRRLPVAPGRPTLEQVWAPMAGVRRRVPRPHEAVRQRARGRALHEVEERLAPGTLADLVRLLEAAGALLPPGREPARPPAPASDA